MFKFLARKEARDVRELEEKIDSLKEDKSKLTEELEKLKLRKKIEEEDIRHMVQINNERKEIQLEKEKLKLERESAAKIAEVKDQYRDKTEQQLEKEVNNMKSMYSEILSRLPNYNVKHKVEEKR